jgi:hypothetical protein
MATRAAHRGAQIQLPETVSRRLNAQGRVFLLSIGKLGADQAKYYLDQAQGRVDVVDSFGEGIEEHYAGGAETRDEWIGTAAASTPADGQALRRVLARLGPVRWSPLRSSSSPTRVGGFDWCSRRRSR